MGHRGLDQFMQAYLLSAAHEVNPRLWQSIETSFPPLQNVTVVSLHVFSNVAGSHSLALPQKYAPADA